GPIFAGVAVGTGDTVTVGQNGTLANILADLTIAGGGLTREQGLARQVTLGDSADTMAHTIMPITLGSHPKFTYLANSVANKSQRGRADGVAARSRGARVDSRRPRR